ncbi:acyltransferase family protein [Paraburkholderia sediminicola]|uniref:acyltransferase family protein n=1 Tax=Paraburkholderia sediminicola TaxID=458836 RepID=UPI000FF0BB45
MSNKLSGVQILRAVAATAVVALHFNEQVGLYGHGGQPWLLSSGIANVGAAGVDIFFVISGFIMYHTTRPRANGSADALGFLKRRAIRILPTYWFWTTIALLAWLTHLGYTSHAFTGEFVVLSYFLIPAVSEGQWGVLLSPGWTLSYEAYFYVLFALCIALVPRRRVAAYTVGAIVLLWGLAHVAPFNAGFVHVSGEPLVFEFAYGVLIAHGLAIWRERIGAGAMQRAGLVLIAAGAVGFAVTVAAPEAAVAHRAFAWGLPAAALVAGTVLARLPTLYSSRLLLLLGDASYSIYLSHQFPMMLLARYLKKGWFSTVSPDVIATAGVVAAIAFGVAAYFAIERPAIAFFSRKSPPLPPVASPTV